MAFSRDWAQTYLTLFENKCRICTIRRVAFQRILQEVDGGASQCFQKSEWADNNKNDFKQYKSRLLPLTKHLFL